VLTACVGYSDPNHSGLATFCDGRALELCDVRAVECRQRFFDYLVCLRERSANRGMPELELAPRHAFTTSLIVDTTTAADPIAAISRVRPALSLLGLSAETSTTATTAAEPPLAAYDLDASVIRFREGRAFDDEEANLAVVQALAHALQSEDVELAQLHREHARELDSWLALRAAIFGEALLWTDMVDAVMNDLYYREYAFESFAANPIPIDDRDPVGASLQLFPHEYGPELVEQAWFDDRFTAVRAVLEAPPSSTLEVLSTVERARGEPPATPFAVRPVLTATLPGYHTEGPLALGAWGVQLFMQRLAPAIPMKRGDEFASSRSALEWRADALWSFTATSKHAAIWMFELDDPTQLVDFVERAAAAGRPWKLVAAGNTRALISASVASELALWEEVARDMLARHVQ
jgi:hypothetical protein